MHPNNTEFDKIIGVRSVLESSDCSTETGSGESDEDEPTCKECYALRQQNGGKGGGKCARARARPTNVNPRKTPCDSCGATGHTTTQCQTAQRHLRAAKAWVKDAECKAC